MLVFAQVIREFDSLSSRLLWLPGRQLQLHPFGGFVSMT